MMRRSGLFASLAVLALGWALAVVTAIGPRAGAQPNAGEAIARSST